MLEHDVVLATTKAKYPHPTTIWLIPSTCKKVGEVKRPSNSGSAFKYNFFLQIFKCDTKNNWNKVLATAGSSGPKARAPCR